MPAPKRILAITKTHQNEGETTRLYRLIGFLLSTGYEVHYIASEPLPLSAHDNLKKHIVSIPAPQLGERWQWLMFLVLSQLKALAILLRRRFSAVIVFGSLYGGLAIVPTTLSWTRLFVFLRSTPWRLAARQRRTAFMRGVARINDIVVMASATKVVVAAQTIKEEIISAYPWLKRSITVVHYGVVLGRHFFSSSDGGSATLEQVEKILAEKRTVKKSLRVSYLLPEDPVVIVVAGMLSRGKNIEVVLRALNASQNEKLVVLICGSGPEKTRLKALTAGFGLENQVIFTGWIENPLELVSECDLFIHPSTDETLSNSLFEALGAGVAVLASDTPLYREVLESNEMLFNPYNVGQLADKFNELGNGVQALAHIREVSHRRAQALASEWGAEVLGLIEKRNA